MLNYRRTDLPLHPRPTQEQEEEMEETCKDNPDFITHAGNSWEEYDARGLYLARVCEHCVKHKLSKYRPEVLSNPNYWTHEPIEED